MRIKHQIFLLAGLACFAASASQQVVTKEGAVYVIPSNCLVRFKANPEWTQVVFDGRFTASGTYAIQYRKTDSEGCEVCKPSWEVWFRPDPSVRERLPHWTRGPVERLQFDNPQDFIRAVLDPEKIRSMESGAINQVVGRATIRASNFAGSIECDAAGYSVTYLGLQQHPKELLASLTNGVEDGC
jgi:hypothetical protein